MIENTLLQKFLVSFVGALSFGVLFRAPKRYLHLTILIGCISGISYALRPSHFPLAVWVFLISFGICSLSHLIAKLANITYVNIAATITCMDETIRQKIEPGGVPSTNRFSMLKEFAKTNASTGLHFMPIIPYLTDNRENVDALYAKAKESRVDYVLPGTLYLRGKTRTVFFDFIKQDFPHLYEPLKILYKTGGAGKDYKDRLYHMVNELKSKYQLSSSYAQPMKMKLDQSGDGT